MAISTRPGPRSTAGGVDIAIKMDERELASILSELAHMPESMLIGNVGHFGFQIITH